MCLKFNFYREWGETERGEKTFLEIKGRNRKAAKREEAKRDGAKWNAAKWDVPLCCYGPAFNHRQ